MLTEVDFSSSLSFIASLPLYMLEINRAVFLGVKLAMVNSLLLTMGWRCQVMTEKILKINNSGQNRFFSDPARMSTHSKTSF